MSGNKRKVFTDSDGSDSASDSELLNISKKRQRTESGSSGSANSPPPLPKRRPSAANGNSPAAAQRPPGSDSDTSTGSDSDWGANTKMKKKKKPLPKSRKSRIAAHGGSDSEPEEGEVSDSDGQDGGGRSGSEEDNEVFDDGLDENLIGDEADRNRLEQMTEKEREQELFNRIEKRDVLKTRFDIEKKLRLAKKQEQRKKRDKDSEYKGKDSNKDKDKSSSGTPVVTLPSDRKKTLEENKAGRSEKFAALKAMRDQKRLADEKEREKKEAEENSGKRDDSDSDVSDKAAKTKLNPSQVFSSDDDSDHSSAKGSSPRRQRSSSSSSSSSSDDNKSGSGSDGSGTSRHRKQQQSSTVTSNDQLERIRLSRHKMERFVHLPIFSKAIIGCFVRVGIGSNFGTPVYRAAEITEVCETAKVYSLGKTKTNKGLRLRHGDQERVFRLEFISNRAFSDSEFNRWVESCANHNTPLPSIDQIEKKEKDIKDLLNYQYTNDDIDTIVVERMRFTNRPTNYAIAKTELMKKRDIAKQCGDDEEVERVNEQIIELDTTSTRLDKRRNATISSIGYINARNRKDNVVKAERAIIAEVQALKGVRAVDPFTRRQTRPCIVTKDSKGTDLLSDDQVLRDEILRKAKVDKENREKEVEAQKKKIIDERAKEDERKRILEEDLYAAHDFDLNIDFGPEMPAVSTPATQSRANGSANNSASTPSATPKRSLNLEEYKKKKGLL